MVNRSLGEKSEPHQNVVGCICAAKIQEPDVSGIERLVSSGWSSIGPLRSVVVNGKEKNGKISRIGTLVPFSRDGKRLRIVCR
jgi:hypothetical protein